MAWDSRLVTAHWYPKKVNPDGSIEMAVEDGGAFGGVIHIPAEQVGEVKFLDIEPPKPKPRGSYRGWDLGEVQFPNMPAPIAEKCGSWRVLAYVEGHEATVRWCDRTSGPCPFPNTPSSPRANGIDCAQARELALFDPGAASPARDIFGMIIPKRREQRSG